MTKKTKAAAFAAAIILAVLMVLAIARPAV